MPRLPGPEQIGGLPSLRSGRTAPSVGSLDTGASAIARGVGRVGDAMVGIAEETRKEDDALDVLKAEAQRRPRMAELENSFDRDSDEATFDQRFRPAAKQIDDEAASVIRNPAVREKWRFRAEMESEGSRNRVLDKGTRIAKEKKYVETVDAITKLAPSPKDSEEVRSKYLEDADNAITLAERSGLVSPLHAHRIRKDHLYGRNGALYREGESALWDDNGRGAYGVLRDLNDGGRPRSGNSTLDFIKGKEGFTSAAKWDYKQHSSGYGTKAAPGETITKEEAERRLSTKVAEIDGWIGQNIKVPLSEKQRTALTSFAYNLGTGKGGLEDLKDDINSGDFDRVAKRMVTFNRAGGKVSDGLTARRREEAAMLQVDPDAEPGIGGGEPSARAKRWAKMDPEARAALATRARTALSSITQQDVEDDLARIRRTGNPVLDQDGKHSLDRAAPILSPNQLSKLRIRWNEAALEHKALSALPDMSEEEAQAHIDSFTPGEGASEESFASTARIQDKARKTWTKIKEIRDKDPAASVIAAPEVRATAERLRGRNSVGIATDEEGNAVAVDLGTGQPVAEPRQVWEPMIKARLDAQTRLGIPEYAQKPITRREADRLLEMPKDVDPSSREYMDRLKAAADRAEQLYGPRYASKALRTAIGYRLRDAENKDVRAAMVAKLARGETISSRELADLSALANISRIGRWFDQPQADPEVDQGLPSLSLDSDSNYSRAGMRLQEASEKAMKFPNESQKKWLEANPDQWQAFDLKFGRGAAAEVLKKGKKK
jgi:GH24 family phage-related lysozyme (muramidase)